MPTPPISAITPRHWMVVGGAGLLMALNVLLFLAVGLLLPPLADSLGVGLGQVMLFVSINMIAGALTLAIVGPFLIRRLGSRRLALIGGSFTGVMLFGVSLVTDLGQLYALAFASGLLGTVSLQMTGAALVNDWFLRRRGLMQGLLMGVASLGGIVAGAVLPPVVATGGWQQGFQLVGGVTVVVALVAGGLLIRSRPGDIGLHVYGAEDPAEEEHKDDAGLSAQAAVRSPQFAALVIALTCFSGIMALQQHFPPLLADRGLDLVAAGTLLSLLSALNVGMTLVLGNLSDRWGPLVAYVLSGGLLVVALTLFLLTVGYPPQAMAVLLFSIPAVTPPILTPVLLRHTFGGRPFVSLLGVATATMPAGVALGSPLWGLSKDLTGSYDPALLIAILLTVLIVALIAYALISGPKLWRAARREPGLLAT